MYIFMTDNVENDVKPEVCGSEVWDEKTTLDYLVKNAKMVKRLCEKRPPIVISPSQYV